jgi:hypothetical protein
LVQSLQVIAAIPATAAKGEFAPTAIRVAAAGSFPRARG